MNSKIYLMIDQITLNRIEILHPILRKEAEHIYKSQISALLTDKIFCRFAFTLRTFQEQADLYAQGRTKLFDGQGKKLGKVTNAKPGQSLHNFGLAIDIVLIVNGAPVWDNVKDFDKNGKADWMEVIDIFKQNGWEWGGDWKSFKDTPHVQKTFGHTWQDLLLKNNNKDFIPGTTYVNI